MVQAINRRLDDQRGSLHQIDDLTLVCMQANPLEAATGEGGQPVTRTASSTSRA
jgi:hypothetical protein